MLIYIFLFFLLLGTVHVLQNEISVTVKHLIKKLLRVAKFYKIDGEFLKAEHKMYASFRRVLSRIRLHDCFRNAGDNAFDKFSASLRGSYPCSETCYIVFCRTIIQCVVQIKTYLRST